MRIEFIRIENFRSFEDAAVPFNKYACLVGPNGAGKSTVLTALHVFFRETENLPTDLSPPAANDRRHDGEQRSSRQRPRCHDLNGTALW